MRRLSKVFACVVHVDRLNVLLLLVFMNYYRIKSMIPDNVVSRLSIIYEASVCFSAWISLDGCKVVRDVNMFIMLIL